jgi:hypothetical protein
MCYACTDRMDTDQSPRLTVAGLLNIRDQLGRDALAAVNLPSA